MQVIIFTNDNGGVSTCIPTGEISLADQATTLNELKAIKV
jgi:hypothetical protein